MATRKWNAYVLVAMLVAIGACAYAQEWKEVQCLPTIPFTYCTLAEGCGAGGRFVKFSPDGRLLASISSTSPNCEVRIWDLQTLQPLRVFPSPHPGMFCFALDFSPDGKLIAVNFASETLSMLRIWDVTSGQLLYDLVEPFDGLQWPAFSPDGKWLAASLLEMEKVKLWDVASGEQMYALSSPVNVLAFSPDGNLLAGALLDYEAQDFRIKLWRVDTWEEVHALSGHTDAIYWLAFSPEGKFVATASSDQTIKLWDVATGQEVQTFLGHTGGLLSVAFSPDGRFIAQSARDHTIRLWDVGSGQEILMIDLWHLLKLGEGFETEEHLALAKKVTRIHAVVFSPDGEFLASSTEIMRPDGCDEAIHIWHLAALAGEHPS